MMKKIFTKKYLCMGKKVLLLAVLAGMLAGTAACSGKETVLLETEDLVRIEGGEHLSEDFSTEEDAVEAPEQVEESTLFVHICGEVMRPGVYELPEGSRVYEAVEEAGGFTQDAAADYVNLAYILEDGWKIEIPSWENLETDGEGKGNGISSGISADAGWTGNGTGDLGGDASGDGLVDINTATKQELITLPGVGESRAESIISYREKNGGFSRIEDIMKVEGIKDGMFAKMKDKICVRGVK